MEKEKKEVSVAEKEGGKKSEDNENDYVKWLFELSKKDGNIAGGKGANLAEMFNSKFPVPPAFVVTAQAYESFIKKTGLYEKIHKTLDEIDIENTKQLQEKAKQIRELIKEQELPEDMKEQIIEAYETIGSENLKNVKGNALEILKSTHEECFVAIRSSATTEDLASASFAGQQETFLNIKGKNNVLEKVKHCFASLFTARAVYYREKRGFEHEKSLIAVVVQKMINADKSGVMFSKNPVGKGDDVVIESVFGLGEGIVSGKIKPDQHIVSRDLEILDENIANKKIAIIRTSSGENETVKLTEEKSKAQVLTKAQINSLAQYAIDLEKHYEKPQDIEFAIESGKIYIVQTRPITTLQEKGEHRELDGRVLLKGLPASPGVSSGKVKIIKSMSDLDKIQKGDVLVTEMTNPDMVVDMQKSAAIVTDEGGITSHAAIVSREMGIPCVVGTDKATQILKDGQEITIDGRAGKVYEGKIKVKGKQAGKTEVLPIVETKTKIKVLVDLPDFAERAAKSQAKDVGLVRLEGIIASSEKHPLLFVAEGRMQAYTEIIARGLEKISKYFQSLWVRASDIRTDEYKNLQGAPKEQEVNPMLGFHGIRFSLKNPEILESEIMAIKKVAEKHPEKKFGIMFPQVISVKEVKQAKKVFEKYKLDNMKFGIMIETPAACEIISELCEQGIEFISFGTNDLTQYTLAVDRGNENIQDLYNETHPAILSQIKKVIKICKEKGVETSICGQAASRKEMVKFLIHQGIDSLSVNADAAADISKFVQVLESKQEQQTEEKETEQESSEKETSEEKQELDETETLAQEVQKQPEKEQKEEFPNTEIGFDVFSPEIKKVDDLKEIEKKSEQIQEQVEKENKEKKEQADEVEKDIQVETEIKEEPVEEQKNFENEQKREEQAEQEKNKEETEIPNKEQIGQENKIEDEIPEVAGSDLDNKDIEEGNREEQEGGDKEEISPNSENEENIDENGVESDSEIKEVVDEMQGKKDDEDIDIPSEESDDKEKDDGILDIF